MLVSAVSPFRIATVSSQRPQVERPFAVWTSYAQCNRQCQLFRVSRVMKLLKTGHVAGCDWTANGRRSRRNGRRGLRYGTLLETKHFDERKSDRSPYFSPGPTSCDGLLWAGPAHIACHRIVRLQRPGQARSLVPTMTRFEGWQRPLASSLDLRRRPHASNRLPYLSGCPPMICSISPASLGSDELRTLPPSLVTKTISSIRTPIFSSGM